MRTSAFLLVLLAACGDPSLKGEGEECFGSAECGERLTCNLGEQPPRCRSMQTPLPDAAASIDAPGAPDADPDAPDGAAPPDAPSAIPDAEVPDADVPDGAPDPS